jgi:competence protein ComEA
MPMDTGAPWRAIDVAATAGPEPPPAPGLARPGKSRLLLAAAAAAVTVSVGAALVVAGQQGGQFQVVSGGGGSSDSPAAAPGSAAAPGGSVAMLVVEVAGAVQHPGVYSLPFGSRVADAIKAAGGYSADVDPRQAEVTLNLAARLVDAQLIHVPRRGEAGIAAASGSAAARASPGLLDLNTATAQELDALPGIGPVTAQKIIDARAQQPFRKVDDLVTRKIVAASVLAKFRALVTVG